MSLRSAVLALSSLAAGTALAGIDIVFPPAGTTVDFSPKCHVLGSVTPADGTNALVCNGHSVKLSRDGAFLFMEPLRPGRNEWTFSRGREKKRHVFTVRGKAAARPQGKGAIEVVSPLKKTGLLLGEEVLLACSAPTGRTVGVTLGERELTLTERKPGRYETRVRFSNEVVRVPVVFWSKGLADVSAGTVTARAAWPAYTVTGPAFETRARELPGGNGETRGYPRPGFVFRSNGFWGDYLRAAFGTNTVWFARASVKEGGKAGARNADAFPEFDSAYPARPAPGRAPQELLVAVDAGHGGDDSGALGPHRRKEKEANLLQAKAIAQALRARGFRVLETRPDDAFVTLYDRVRLAYGKRADLFLSVHHNACGSGRDPSEARNCITYWSEPRGESLAAAIQSLIAPVSGVPDGGIARKSLAVCRNPAVPSCLIEFDFINTPEGEAAIFDAARREAFARAVAEGVFRWTRCADGKKDAAP